MNWLRISNWQSVAICAKCNDTVTCAPILMQHKTCLLTLLVIAKLVHSHLFIMRKLVLHPYPYKFPLNWTQFHINILIMKYHPK